MLSGVLFVVLLSDEEGIEDVGSNVVEYPLPGILID
jgi:hypothetical protein